MLVTITLTKIWHVRPWWWECFLRPIVLLALIVHLDEVDSWDSRNISADFRIETVNAVAHSSPLVAQAQEEANHPPTVTTPRLALEAAHQNEVPAAFNSWAEATD